MKSTIVLCSHNRPIQEATRAIFGELTTRGAAYISQSGSSDVTLARNLALTGACQGFRQLNQSPGVLDGTRPPFDTLLMVDDDMVFTVDQAQELVNYTRAHAMPASAMYATAHGMLAAHRLKTPVGEKQLWLTGLGLLAIPSWRLLELEKVSERFHLKEKTHVAFTSSSVRDGRWFSEDYEFTTRLGGVHLLPMAAGHLKTIPIYPDDVSVAAIRDGGELPESLTAEEIDTLEPRRVARNAEGGRG